MLTYLYGILMRGSTKQEATTKLVDLLKRLADLRSSKQAKKVGF